MPSYQKFLDTAVMQEITVNQPAAGADWSLTVPTELTYRLETLFFTFATSSVVANRLVKLQITDGTNIVWEGGSNSLYAASGTYHFGPSRLASQMTSTGSGSPQILHLPDIWLPAGYVVKTLTNAIDVGDQYSVIRGLASVSTAL